MHFRNELAYILLKPVQNNHQKDDIGSFLFKKSISQRKRFIINFGNLVSNCFTRSLMLPMWLSKGIGSLTMDNFLLEQSITTKTLEIFNENIIYKEVKDNYCSINKREIFLYNYVKGYWTVRYLEENYPGFLKEIFKEYKGEDIVQQIRIKLGLDSEEFWEQLDELLYENYKYLLDK